MIKEAIQYLLSLGTVEQHAVNGQTYSDKQLHLLPEPTPGTLIVRNLSGVVDYLQSNYDNQPPVLIQIASPTKVHVYSTFNNDMKRKQLIQAEALLPDIPFEKFMDTEHFNVLLQSCFVTNDFRADLLAVVGSITESNVTTVGDDGVSQQVTGKSGVAILGNIPVPNPVLLKPYRTFVEIPQPESSFIFRMRTGPSCALFEADGGAWKLDAIEGIKKYLSGILSKEIEDGFVTIIA